MSTDNSLVNFKAIVDFVNNLGEMFSKEQHSLKLYSHLLNKTTLSHDKAIKKHIEAFRNFCVVNREGILNKDIMKITNNKISYSDKVYINIKDIFKISDKDTKDIIWKHLLFLSALLDPAGKAKQLLKQSNKSTEGDFLTDIISKVEDHVDPNSNPVEAISNIMKSGIFTEIVGGMNKGLNDGTLDLNKLMGTVQSMVNVVGSNKEEKSSNEIDAINMMMGNLLSGNTASSDSSIQPNIVNILGPLISGLQTNEESNKHKIEEI